jgi:DNA-binding transcriptional ArsR family regulator
VVYTTSVKRQTHDRPVRQLQDGVVLNCVGYRVRRLSRVVSGIYDEALGPLKLKISQFSILAVLDRQGPLTAVDLCRLLMMDKSTASRNLQRLRRRGWISLVKDRDGSGQSYRSRATVPRSCGRPIRYGEKRREK